MTVCNSCMRLFLPPHLADHSVGAVSLTAFVWYFLIVGISTFKGRKHVCFSLYTHAHTCTYIQTCLSARKDLIFSVAKKVVKRLSWQSTKASSLAQVCVLCNLGLWACFYLFYAFLRKINFQPFQVLCSIHMDVFKHQLLEKYQVLWELNKANLF